MSQLEFSFFQAGDVVTAIKAIYEPADDCHPGGCLARPGEKLIVREVRERGQWPIKVSHEDVTDGHGFCVAADELVPFTS